ncbi:hypothetical protein BT69DRAFT_62275 [Atractiella rhizophila]|nr:hypothetical protein BT69DRAFT_62275 [Atractiella rhizophila]
MLTSVRRQFRPLRSTTAARVRQFSLTRTIRQAPEADPEADVEAEDEDSADVGRQAEEDFGEQGTRGSSRVTLNAASGYFETWKATSGEYKAMDPRFRGAAFPGGEKFKHGVDGTNWLGGEVPFPGNPTFRPGVF